MLTLAASMLLLSAPAANVISVGFARAQYDAPAVPISPDGEFLITFSNVFDKPVKLIGEGCSWGYGAVTFEVTNPAGKTFEFKRKERAWDKNYPIPVMVEPGVVLLRKIDFGDGTWEGFPAGVGGQLTGWRARVVFTVTPDWMLTKDGFWIGQVSSPWLAAKVSPA